MINFATILAAVKSQLVAQLPATASNGRAYIVERGNVVNADPALMPWVGVYRARSESEPGRMGTGSGIKNWDSVLSIQIVVQAASYRDGEHSDDLLGEFTDAVEEAIETDHTLGGTVEMITGYEVAYSYNNEDSASIIFQNAVITITARTRT